MFGIRSPPARISYRIVLVAFVFGYVGVEAVVTFSVGRADAWYAGAMGLMVLLNALAFLGNLLDSRRTAQRFYLALSIVPALTVARLAFLGVSVAILNPLLVYLLLAVTVLVFRQSTGSMSELPVLSGRQLARSVPLGAALGAGIAIFGLAIPLQTVPAAGTPLMVSVLVLAPVALLDEFWFRGILQGTFAGVTSARWGWLATAALFAAYGAPFGPPNIILFRLGYGLVLGAMVVRRENLPVALFARITMAVALALLVPSLLGTSAIV